MEPVDEQIKAEIKKLEEMKPHVLKTSLFGDNHHDAIDAVLEVLRGRISIHDIDERYPYATGDEDADEVPENIHTAAMEAAKWLEGETDETPSSGYEGLDQRNPKAPKQEDLEKTREAFNKKVSKRKKSKS